MAILIVAALAAQFDASSAREGFSSVRFFSFFTNQSNILAAAMFLWLGIARPSPSRATAMIRGAVTVYMTITGIVYELLLSGDPAAVEATLSWVNLVVHVIMPIAVAADWLLDPPNVRLKGREVVWWFAFPLVWTTYTLIRGAADGWYPYPFLDSSRHGVIGVAGYAAAIAITFVVMIALVAWVGNLRQRG